MMNENKAYIPGGAPDGVRLKAANGAYITGTTEWQICDNGPKGCHCQAEVEFVNAFGNMQAMVHRTAIAHGWWDQPREVGTVIMNCVGELAEMFDALAHGNPPDKHCPDFTAAEVEAADVIIRLMDAAEQYGWDLAGAIVTKAEYNKGREYRHGKEF
jgi:hypothetical protein